MSDTEEPQNDSAGKSYDVGYKKPPKHSRFKPGRSGNPRGRPKGARDFTTDLKATLKEPVKITREGKPRRVSTQLAALMRLREKALNGDARALDRLIGLAQSCNDEEFAVPTCVSDSDAEILEIYQARILSGAVGSPRAAIPSDESGSQRDGAAGDGRPGPKPESEAGDNAAGCDDGGDA